MSCTDALASTRFDWVTSGHPRASARRRRDGRPRRARSQGIEKPVGCTPARTRRPGERSLGTGRRDGRRKAFLAHGRRGGQRARPLTARGARQQGAPACHSSLDARVQGRLKNVIPASPFAAPPRSPTRPYSSPSGPSTSFPRRQPEFPLDRAAGCRACVVHLSRLGALLVSPAHGQLPRALLRLLGVLEHRFDGHSVSWVSRESAVRRRVCPPACSAAPSCCAWFRLLHERLTQRLQHSLAGLVACVSLTLAEHACTLAAQATPRSRVPFRAFLRRASRSGGGAAHAGRSGSGGPRRTCARVYDLGHRFCGEVHSPLYADGAIGCPGPTGSSFCHAAGRYATTGSAL